ncbi:related to anaphase control protein cut9 [Melanopsichium pennsylvanicum]|uniref:Related to anaphase control protein cut9 n=2 Tax=Melanopsichium pennsylvanicum TaxID=63383 RepID=A0AAJ5C6C0_9BASI|nr:related to anaphase control protein cut9 [Melanopsichium pennsylvanicum 4]SNX85666.1 related to anaphase control protein cut9 [Melanopsichium pennsylvanicum]
MAQTNAASSPGFPFNSPKPRQVTKLAHAGPSNIRSAPQSPHTPTNHQPLALNTFNPDGSLSVVRNDDDANNSGLLDLSPALARGIKSRPNFGRPDGTPSSKRQPRANPHSSLLDDGDSNGIDVQYTLPKRKAAAKSRLSNHAAFGDAVPSSQPTEDLFHSESQAANGLATAYSPDVESYSRGDARLLPNLAALDSGDDEISIDDDQPISTLTRLRRWRQDAMQQHLYETAIFWGTKILSLENTASAFNDAYHLAQCYFYTHQYARAEQLLTTPLRSGSSSRTDVVSRESKHGESTKQTGAEGCLASDIVQEDDDALHEILQATRESSILPAAIMARSTTKDSMYSATSSTTGKRKNREFNVTATGTGTSETDSSGVGLESDEEFLKDASFLDPGRDGSVVFKDVSAVHPRHAAQRKKGSKVDLQSDLAEVKASTLAPAQGPILVNHSLACRYLAAQCQVRLAKYHEALDVLGETVHWVASTAHNKTPSSDGGIKLGSSVAYLRGQIHLRLEDLPKAKDSFMAALALDIKNYEAFSALVDGELLGVEEQWSFVQGLEYVAQSGTEPGAKEDYELIRLLYTTRLSKQGKDLSHATAVARKRLTQDYGLGHDPDVLLGLASELFTQLRFADAFIVTSHILTLSADHPATLPIHIACTYHLKNLRPALFMLAHRLTELQPESPVSWFAVGVWYASTKRWAEARRYFSKASLLDPRFAPGWIAFGHTFAMEGESDQAIIAYSTAGRLFPQSHLPRLFVGMEHLHQDNLSLARLSLDGAAKVWNRDALLANERGVVAFQTGDLIQATEFFETAIELAKETQHPASSWKSTYLNLGLANMRQGREAEAKEAFQSVVELDPHNYQAHLCLGMIAHKQDGLEEAIGHYHEALSINPRDAFATELLDFVLEEKVHYGVGVFSRYDPQGKFFSRGHHVDSGIDGEEGSMLGSGNGKGKARQVEASLARPSAVGRTTGLASIPEQSSPSSYMTHLYSSSRQEHSLPNMSSSTAASSRPTTTSARFAATNNTISNPDASAATAAEMSLDNSTSLHHSHDQSHSQTQAESLDQSSVLMDESTS